MYVLKGCEVGGKVKTMAVSDKTKAAFNKTKAASDKTQAVFLVFRSVCSRFSLTESTFRRK